MATEITADNLLVPSGRLEPSWFPLDTSDTLEKRLSGYLNDANIAFANSGLTGSDLFTALRTFAYAKAFRAIADRMNINPATANFGGAQGSIGYTDVQKLYFTGLAAQYEAMLDDLLVVENTSTAGRYLVTQSLR